MSYSYSIELHWLQAGEPRRLTSLKLVLFPSFIYNFLYIFVFILVLTKQNLQIEKKGGSKI